MTHGVNSADTYVRIETKRTEIGFLLEAVQLARRMCAFESSGLGSLGVQLWVSGKMLQGRPLKQDKEG